MTSRSEELAAFCHSLRFGDLPESAVRMAKLLFLDWLGSVVRGGEEKMPRIMEKTFAPFEAPRESTVIYRGTRTSCLTAVMLNGAAAHTLQLSDIHKGTSVGNTFLGSSVHPSIPVITPAFAMAEREKSTGKELIAAMIVGYEVVVRVAEAVFPSHHAVWNPTGTCGVFGSTVAAGKLIGLNERQMVSSIGAAGLQAAGLWEGVSQGCICSEFVSGKASMNGIVAALLAKEGFVGPRDIFEGKQGFLGAMSAAYDAEKLTRGLDSCLADPKIMGTSFKVHAACGHTHSAIDAILIIARSTNVALDEIDDVHIRLYPRAIEFLGDVEPEDPASAQFSLKFCIASALRDRAVTLDSFSQDRLLDRKIRAFMSKIRVEEEKEFGRLFPEKWMAASEIITTDGRKFEAVIEYPKGHPKNPLSEDEIIDKFFSLTDGRISTERAERLKEDVLHLEDVNDMSIFLKSMVVA